MLAANQAALWEELQSLIRLEATQRTQRGLGQSQLELFTALWGGADIQAKPRLTRVDAALRRLLACFELEAIADEQTSYDFQKRVELRREDAKIELQRVLNSNYLQRKLDLAGAQPDTAEILSRAATDIETRCTTALELLNSPLVEREFDNMLADLWSHVSARWGTFYARTMKSNWGAFVAAAVALVVYIFLGRLLPSPWVLFALSIFPLFFYWINSYLHKSGLQKAINQARDIFALLDMRLSPSKNIWYAERYQDLVRGALDKLSYARKLVQDKIDDDRRFRRYFPLLAPILAGIVSAVALGSIPATRFVVLSEGTPGGFCALAQGTVWWAGPLSIVVRSDDGRLSIISPRAVSQILESSDEQTIDSCNGSASEPLPRRESHSDLQPFPDNWPSYVYAGPPDTFQVPTLKFDKLLQVAIPVFWVTLSLAPRKSVETPPKPLALFKTAVKYCDPKPLGVTMKSGTTIQAPDELALRAQIERLLQQDPGRPACVAVIGLSSKKPFQCPNGDKLNLTLAQQRTKAVRALLRQWYPEFELRLPPLTGEQPSSNHQLEAERQKHFSPTAPEANMRAVLLHRLPLTDCGT